MADRFLLFSLPGAGFIFFCLLLKKNSFHSFTIVLATSPLGKNFQLKLVFFTPPLFLAEPRLVFSRSYVFRYFPPVDLGLKCCLLSLGDVKLVLL